MKWTAAQIAELERLSGQGLYRKEIAERMGIDTIAVRYKARQLKLPKSPRLGSWNVKHQHLRGPVMKYFLTHSWEETQKHFGLAPGELKSVFSNGYRDPKFKHLRKETRNHTPWKSSDWLFMAAHCGLISRAEISKRMGRTTKGKHHAVKDRLRGRSGSRYLNGLTATLAHELLPDVAFISILTKAGSPGCKGATQARIVPWVMLEDLTQGRPMNPTIRSGIKAMARFQRWIHGAKNNGQAMEKVMKILNGEKRKR